MEIRKPVFLFTDLDHTVLLSHRHEAKEPVVWVEEWKGRPQSYMYAGAWRYFKSQDWLKVIPVTTRTREQYQRLYGSLAELGWREALVCNGAVLLRDGQEEAAWTRESLLESEKDRDALLEAFRTAASYAEGAELVQVLGETGGPPEQELLYFYSRGGDAEALYRRLSRTADKEHLFVGRDARKVYCIPLSLQKGRALERYRRLYGTGTCLAAGDSAFDISMLQRADLCFFPEDLEDFEAEGEKIPLGGLLPERLWEELQRLAEKGRAAVKNKSGMRGVMKKTFEIDDLLKIARRTNNQKRPYLYVNPLQGKHVPVSPSVTLALFRLLAEKVESRYKGEKLLVIGFAETATAIGFTIACRAENVTYAMCTTREEVEGAEYLFFTESHSHATEQRLVLNRLPEVLEQVDRVVFAEDEVTTGRTIEKLIRELVKRYPDRELKFGIVSILNSMTKERLAELENEGVICDFLHRIPAGHRTEEINRFRYESAGAESVCGREAVFQELFLGDGWNGRLPADTKTIWDTCQRFAQNAFRAVFPEEERDPKPRQEGAAEGSGETGEKKILVLGTEECMFPGLLFGAAIEEKCPGWRVRFHATTRSPIEVSEDPDYPLHTRWPLCSLYEAGRRTFVYNLEAYDRVFVVTDAAPVCREGQQNLAEALISAGSTDITLIQWGGPGRE